MGSRGILAYRAVILALSGLLGLCIWRVVAADNYSHRTGDPQYVAQGIERALELNPTNVEYLIWKANVDANQLYSSDGQLRADFEKVLDVSPHQSEALMNLALLYQRSGDLQRAEEYLVEAVANDHRFKPAWTLANFYFATNQTEKFYSQARRCLEIADPGLQELARLSPEPVFDLCWRFGASPQQLRAMLPARPGLLVSFFFSLLTRRDLSAALSALPEALQFADSKDPVHRNAFQHFCGLLLDSGRTRDAVSVWNQLIEHGMLNSSRLDPGKGISLADPSLEQPFPQAPFGWEMKQSPHIEALHGKGWIQFRLDGHQADQSELLSAKMPLLPGRDYMITRSLGESTAGSRLKETGLLLQVLRLDGQLIATCPDLFSPGPFQCGFTVPKEVDILQLRVLYQRPPGVSRLSGTYSVSSFGIGFANMSDASR